MAYRLKFSQSHAHCRLRKRVYERDNFTCQHCGYRPPNEEIPDNYSGRRSLPSVSFLIRGLGPELQLDHILPYSRGGKSHESNLQTLCEPCNRRKGHKLPADVS